MKIRATCTVARLQQRAANLSSILITCVSLCALAQADELAWTDNLLSNPGAEAGTLAGWMTDDPVIVQASTSQDTSSGIVTPFSGTWFFNMGSAPAAPTGVSITKRLYQDVDVNTYGAAIDKSQVVAAASVYFQTEDRPRVEGSDYAWLAVYFIDSDGAAIDSWTARLQSPNLAWVKAHLEGAVPSGTTSIVFELVGEKFESTYVNSFFDDAKLRLGLTKKNIQIDLISGKNKINLNSNRQVWVAILSDTDDYFDPVQVDISTVRFGPDGAEANRYKVRDINRDGVGDLILRFKIRHTGIACDDKEASMTAETYDGQSLVGTASIRTICHR